MLVRTGPRSLVNRGALLAALLLAPLAARAVLPPQPSEAGGPLPDWDVRGLEAMATLGAPTAAQVAALAALREEVKALPGGEIVARFGPQPGTLHLLFRREGWLTGPAPAGFDAEARAREFATSHSVLLGVGATDARSLRLARRYPDPGTGALHLFFEQEVAGVRVFHGELRVSMAADGRILVIGGDTAPTAVACDARSLSPSDALAAAAASVRVPLASPPTPTGRDASGRFLFAAGPFASAPSVDEVWFPEGQGLIRAYRVVVDPRPDPGWYQVVVDAGTGAVLCRTDLVQFVASYGLVFREDPGQGPQVQLPFVDDTVYLDPASPFGWSQAGETQGNNCDVKDDIAADDEATIGHRAQASGPDPLAFAFPFTDNPTNDLDASLTNLFRLNNWLHDHDARLGFDEAAGNFQQVNASGLGKGGDPEFVDAQDGSGRNNANFGTPPDGQSPRMQMYIWTYTNPNRDSGFDASVVTHEFHHGVSNRLVGGPDDTGCLAGAQSGAMGEAWSDFFACSFWNETTVGGYVVNDYVRGIRRAPYDQYPFNYGDLCNWGGFEVHQDGEIWAATLWDLRTALIGRYGYEEGACRVERLVLDGMKLSPCRPTYVDERDAILLAAEQDGDDGDLCLLWQAFAGRGLGPAAVSEPACTSASDTDFTTPPGCGSCALGAVGATTADTTQPNVVTIRFTPAAGADTHVLLRSPDPCPVNCAAAFFTPVATGSGTATSLVDADAPGAPLSVGVQYSYRVEARAAGACTAYGACVRATVTGRCTLPPEAASSAPLGVTALERPPEATCHVRVRWSPARTPCDAPARLRYNVYRSTDPAFTPDPSFLIASVLAPALAYDDVHVPATAATYVVRAEDLTTGGRGPHGGNEEANVQRLTLTPQGPTTGTTAFTDDAESGEKPGYQRTGTMVPNDWGIVTDANTRGGSAWHVTDVEGGNADKNLVLPLLSLGAAPHLSFVHIYDMEPCYDGGVIEISQDSGRTWRDLIGDVTAGGYATSQNGCGGVSSTVGGMMNPPNTLSQLWTGQNASGFGTYDTVDVDLTPYANTLDAQVRLRALVDEAAFAPGGWYVDDLRVDDVLTFGACADACTSPPTAVLSDVTACAPVSTPTSVLLDASSSQPGAAGYSRDLPFVFTVAPPGSFGGRSWAVGTTAVLTFPVGTPAGAYPVTVTVRGADTCGASATATVTLAIEGPLPSPVGGTLRVTKAPAGLSLAWGDVGASRYNVHAVPLGASLATLIDTVPVATTSATPYVLSTPSARPGGGTLFLEVFSASSCGRSIP